MPAALTVQGHPSSADSWAAALIKRAPWLWGDELRPASVCKRFPQCARRCPGRPFRAGPGPFLRLGLGVGRGSAGVTGSLHSFSGNWGSRRRTPEFSPHTLVMIVPLRARQLTERFQNGAPRRVVLVLVLTLWSFPWSPSPWPPRSQAPGWLAWCLTHARRLVVRCGREEGTKQVPPVPGAGKGEMTQCFHPLRWEGRRGPRPGLRRSVPIDAGRHPDVSPPLTPFGTSHLPLPAQPPSLPSPHAPRLASLLPWDTEHCSFICGQPDLALAAGHSRDKSLGQAGVWIRVFTLPAGRPSDLG